MDQKQQIAERIKQANNILVTVSNNPSVDQLASCIGLTLAFNKMGKHATAVFSGAVPSTLEFLEPEKTLEATTDSLRDFIISLDKAKADKLRYKVEDKVVKIFITPYRTSINDKDLEFSQGDFNVDVVLALGVHQQNELDQAITAHGRILHDATVASLNIKPGGELGSLNWTAPGASSLSELAVDLLDTLDKKMIDSQIATAFLTGIVAETKRFSNERTSPDTMSISAELMAAGANQQLVATKLEPPAPPPPPVAIPEEHAPLRTPSPSAPAEPPKPAQPPKSDDGTLEIAHADKAQTDSKKIDDVSESKPEPEEEEKADTMPQIHIDDQGGLHNIEEEKSSGADSSTDPTQHLGSSRMILQPPSMGATMSTSGTPEESFSSDPLSLPQPGGPQDNSGQSSFISSPASATISAPAMPFMPPSMTPGTLSVPPVSPVQPPPALDVPQGLVMPTAPPVPAPEPDTTHVDNARDAVMQAIAGQPSPPQAIQALNAHPLGDVLHSTDGTPPDLNVPVPAEGNVSTSGLNIPAPVGLPPPVPPPMMAPPSQ